MTAPSTPQPAPAASAIGWTPPIEKVTPPTPFPTAPPEPESLAAANISEADFEALLLKTLLNQGTCTGGQVASIVCTSRSVVNQVLGRLREELLVSIKNSVGVNDYLFQLTEAGHAKAQRHAEQCKFTGPAPVTLAAYETAIRRQSLQKANLKIRQLSAALSGLTMRADFVSQVAQAVNDGRGLFLYGSPGNGKTTLAERIIDAFGQYIWVPRMISVGGDLIRLFDPSCHEEAKLPQLEHARYDRRWVLIRRPTVVVGGELTLEQLDVSFQESSGVSEAPVQLKANGGALLIDDFGRQRVSSTDILNRLIVPLEKQYDFLNLASGRKVQTPFDLLFILSTNLAPRELVDEAFLRRIPYKIEVHGPTEDEFRGLLKLLADEMGYEVAPEAIEYLFREHFVNEERPLRFCHPRDLLRQVKNYCEVHELPRVINETAWDVAVRNYFVEL